MKQFSREKVFEEYNTIYKLDISKKIAENKDICYREVMHPCLKL